MHLQGEAPLEQIRREHNGNPTRDVTVSSTNFTESETDQLRLPILEAALIHYLKPTLNKQHTGIRCTLKLHSFHNPNNPSTLPPTPQSNIAQSVIQPSAQLNAQTTA